MPGIALVSSPLSPLADVRPAQVAFDALYQEHFDFVYRTVRRLGVDESAAEDVTQEVFVTVHRGLGGFEGRSAVKTWLFGIARNVVFRHRRTIRRRIVTTSDPSTALESRHDESAPSTDDGALRREAVRVLDGLLAELDDDKREVFVLVELEEMSMPETAEALGLNVNTAYTRLRAANQQFEAALARHRARSAWKGAR